MKNYTVRYRVNGLITEETIKAFNAASAKKLVLAKYPKAIILWVR